MRYKASGTYLRTKVFDTVDKAVDAARKVMYMDAQELLDARTVCLDADDMLKLEQGADE